MGRKVSDGLNFLLTYHYKAIQVATYKVSYNQADIEQQHATYVFLNEAKGNGQVVERIGYAVRESAKYEHGNCKEQREPLIATGKRYGCGHQESATYGEQSGTYGSDSQSAFKNLLSGFLKRHGRYSGKQGNQKATNDITQQDKQQVTYLTLHDEAGSTGIEFKLVADYGDKAESEHNCAYNTTQSQKTESCNSNADSRKYRRLENSAKLSHIAKLAQKGRFYLCDCNYFLIS